MARTFVVAHDFSPCAEAAARAALTDLRALGGGKLVLVHAYTMLPVGGASSEIPPDAWSVYDRALTDDAGRRLDLERAALRRLLRGDESVEILGELRAGPPAEAIVASANEHHAARIVVGTHGRRGLAHVFLGSVAERVVRLASAPVLVVKAST